MTALSETDVSAHVARVSKEMANPRYAEMAVGVFVEQHPDAGRFLGAHSEDLGGSEGVIHAVFHAQVLVGCFERVLGKPLPSISFAALDQVATGSSLDLFKVHQPSLADYLATNVEGANMQRLLALLGLAMDRIATFSRGDATP
ncbi:MAG: hypothetical protein KC416_02530 [Myxococcales bacterium]|nr:hypothetical protein [Myxococcales bacterium]